MAAKKSPKWQDIRDEDVQKRLGGPAKHFKPKTKGQAEYLRVMGANIITLCSGPAGTGKTALATWVAARMLEEGQVDRIILTRPAVECGDTVGFLPGGLQEKVAPYLVPLLDALYEYYGPNQTNEYVRGGQIELGALGYMRGRTFKRCFVVLDEAQNAEMSQLHMLMTRIGPETKMVLAGDVSQSDFRKSHVPFADVVHRFQDVDKIGVMELGDADIVRHPLIELINQKFAA
jgi:phosphate starvation-inducible PhoH-like protein